MKANKCIYDVHAGVLAMGVGYEQTFLLLDGEKVRIKSC